MLPPDSAALTVTDLGSPGPGSVGVPQASLTAEQRSAPGNPAAGGHHGRRPDERVSPTAYDGTPTAGPADSQPPAARTTAAPPDH